MADTETETKTPKADKSKAVDRTDLPVPKQIREANEPDLAGTVKYIGKATTRVITKEEWQNIPPEFGGAVMDQDTVTWMFRNNKHVLPIDMFSDKALDYLERDGRFLITE